LKKNKRKIVINKIRRPNSGLAVKINKQNHYAVIEPIEKIETKQFISLNGKPIKTGKITPKRPEMSFVHPQIKPEEIKPQKIETTILPEKKSESPLPFVSALPDVEENEMSVKQEKPKTEEPAPKKEIEKEKPEETSIEVAYKLAKEKIDENLPIDMIETDIDKMMNILETNKSVSIGELSKQLNVKVELIENWAKILEEHDLVEIEYPIIGLPKLRKKEWKEEL
jgi:DNA-binding transcriptional ArsR family regulator